MSLTDADLDAINELVKKQIAPLNSKIDQVFFRLDEKIDARTSQLEERMNLRFNVVDANFDALFKRDETRQQEYMVIASQMTSLDARVSTLEKKSA